jgi:chromosome segregation ATPase
MSKQDQDMHKFHMACVLSISRLLESRCQSLFAGLIEAQRWARDEVAKEKTAWANKAETDSLLAEAQESLQKATAKLLSIQRQHQEQCEELIEEKSALLVGLEDEQTETAELHHEQKSKEATITRLTIEVQTFTSGNKALAESIDELNEKLAAAKSKSKADIAKWATDGQRLKNDVTRSQQKELQTKTERDAVNEAINQVCTEEEEFKQWTISKRSAFSTSLSNRLFSRITAEELTSIIRDQSRGQSSSSGRKGLGSDTEVRQKSTRTTSGQQ